MALGPVAVDLNSKYRLDVPWIVLGIFPYSVPSLMTGCVMLRHCPGAVDFAREVVPTSQLIHALAPVAGWYVPAAQSVQTVIEPSPYVPAGQVWQSMWKPPMK